MYVANRDSNTVSVIVTISPTPQQAIQQLIDDIKNNPEINKHDKASLVRILDLALKLLNETQRMI